MRIAESVRAPISVLTTNEFHLHGEYDDPTVMVHEGDTVEWKNENSTAHTATAAGEDQRPAFDSGGIGKGT
jgi:plastocyanin